MKNINNYIFEQLSKLKDQRRDILIKRLAYLKYSDETKGNKDFKKLYDLLFNFLFDEYGNVRDNRNLYNYIEKLIQDNNGTIPDLPNNGTIETIDKKINALDEIEPSTLKKYIKEVEKEAVNKEKSGKKSNDDSFENEMKDSELKEKINDIIDTEGLTNILGLESSQKMSALDKDKLKDKEDNIKQNIPDHDEDTEGDEDTEDEEGDITDDQIEGFIKTGKMKKPEEDLSDAFLENLNVINDSKSLNEASSKEISEEERKQNIKKVLVSLQYISDTETDPKKKEMCDRYLEFYKKTLYDENGQIRSIDDATKYYKSHRRKSLKGFSERTGYRITLGYAADENSQKEWESKNPKAWKSAENKTEKFINTQEKDYVQNVTDVDGSIIKPRKKMNGTGVTFVRVKNGHEVGYATREEYLAAKRRKLEKSKIKKESIELISLVNYICS